MDGASVYVRHQTTFSPWIIQVLFDDLPLENALLHFCDRNHPLYSRHLCDSMGKIKYSLFGGIHNVFFHETIIA